MKTNKRLLKQTLFAIAAIPIGAVGASLCEGVIRAAAMLLGAATSRTTGMEDIHLFFEFELPLLLYSVVPFGAVALPLAYLLFFRYIVLKQAFQILGWLMLGTIIIGIPGSILLHSSMSGVFGFFLGVFYAQRRIPPERRPAVLKRVLGLAVILVLAWLMPTFSIFLGVFWSVHAIKGVERRMKNPQVYETVETNLALYCQSISSLNLTNEVGSAYLPQPIPQLNEDAWGRFDSDSAFIEFGGGFYHYGYALHLAANTFDLSTNHWEFYFQSEGSPDSLLASFALPSSARMSLAVFESNVLSEYSRRIAADPANLDYHKGRIRFLLNYEPDRIRQACLDAIKNIPDGWWPRLALAIWDSGHGKFTDASKEFAEFVEKKPSYSRYIYLAWFYQTMNHPNEAAAAIEKAVQFPIVDLPDDDDNTECRGYTVGVSAYRSGKYDAVIKLCDVLLPVRINGDYAKSGLGALRSSAEASRNRKAEPFQPDGHILFFDPFENMNLTQMLGH